ncbi:protein of unknown function [Methylocaldum szegediense]|uniref:Uncharacterized protein n=1 Tax=Methylocaldum szegediense TaxID=73780 RepID=A0ABN8XDJ4_9GAMM|nr:protein of unknown function [Methylocaldum szegediense]
MSALVDKVYTKDFSRKFWGWIFLNFVIDIAKTRLVVFLEAGWGVALFAIRAGLSNPPYRDAVHEWTPTRPERPSEGPTRKLSKNWSYFRGLLESRINVPAALSDGESRRVRPRPCR